MSNGAKPPAASVIAGSDHQIMVMQTARAVIKQVQNKARSMVG